MCADHKSIWEIGFISPFSLNLGPWIELSGQFSLNSRLGGLNFDLDAVRKRKFSCPSRELTHDYYTKYGTHSLP